jgi:hypothetical protein
MKQLHFSLSASIDKASCRLAEEILNALNNIMMVRSSFL